MSLKEYNTKIERAASESKAELQWNDSRANNAIIMKEMFRYANEIKMYCGEGSIFKQSFAERVSDEVEEGDYNPMEDLYGQINNFLKKDNSKLTIILQKEKSIEGLSPQLEETWNDKRAKKDIVICKLDDKLDPRFHFSIGDKRMYRREIGAEEHSAFADFNDSSCVSILEQQFKCLLDFSKEI